MIRFFNHLFIITILTVVLSIVCDKIYALSFEYGLPRNKVQVVANLENAHIDYIFLGSSRVENHIDCDLIESLTGKSCLNLGLQGGRLKDYRVLTYLLKHNKVTYEKLLVQVDYSYNFDDYSNGFIASIAPYVNNSNFPKELRNLLELPRAYNLPFYRFIINDNIIGFRESLMQLLKKDVNADLTNGFVPLNGIGTEISGHFPEKIASSNIAFDDILTLNLKQIIPFAAPYCKSTSSRDSFMDDLKIIYPSIHSYIDLFDDEEGMFVNCGHLNERGAKKFTKILTEDILLN